MATDDGYFGEAAAASYDENAAERFSPEVLKPTVGLIAELAGDGSVLEFGIGTGRVAMALSQRGIPVSGIELSRAMVSKLREKPGSDAIQVTIGDMATTTVGASFRVVYLVFNTIMNLTTQSAQVACFRNASAHLEPGGCFVIECMVPELRRLPPGETFRVFYGSDGYWGIDEYDTVTQSLVSHHVKDVNGRFDRWSMPARYVWPSELDLMAELAGLSLRERWGDWNREPFTAESCAHISVWQKSATKR
jgi:SAM-dependent methyltransferase